MKIFKQVKRSKIEEILNNDEELIHKFENIKFPKNASWRKRGSWNNTAGLVDFDINSKAYHGKIYVTDKRIIFEGGRNIHIKDQGYEIEKGLCTINLEEIIQFKYSVVDQWLWKKPQLRKWDITGRWTILGNNQIFPKKDRRIIGEKIKYEACPFGPELLIEKRNGKSEKFILPKATPAIIEKLENIRKNIVDKMTSDAKDREIALDYDEAIQIWEKLGKIKEATRIRKLKTDSVKVDQTVVHGDYVDDRDTIIKDSVLNRSNVGASGDKSKSEELREAKALLDDGIIDDAEFKQMKKEILGK